MGNMKYMIIPVISGTTGIVTKGLKNNLEAITGKHSIDSLQKTAMLGTSHIMRKVLQCETLSPGSPLVQEKYREKGLMERRRNDNNNNNNNEPTELFLTIVLT